MIFLFFLNLIISILKQKKGGDLIAIEKTEYVTSKVIVAGDVIEVFDYSEGYRKGYTLTEGEKSNRGRISGAKSQNYEVNREVSLARAKTSLRRKINANVGQYGAEFTSKFVTLTFGEHITDLSMAHYEFKKFILRLNYAMFGAKKAEYNVRYTAIPEFTKKGRVHYHVIFYNLPYIKADLLAEIWGNGFIKINKIDNVDNVGAYMTKYMTKEADNALLAGRKSHFSSKGLFKFEEITENEAVEMIKESLSASKLKYTCEYDNEWLGTVHYRQYNLTL